MDKAGTSEMLGGVGFASVIAGDAGVVDVVNDTGPTTFKEMGELHVVLLKVVGLMTYKIILLILLIL